MKIKDSYLLHGWVGLQSKDELGNYEETDSFKDIKAVEKYIANLQKALEIYKKERKPQTKI